MLKKCTGVMLSVILSVSSIMGVQASASNGGAAPTAMTPIAIGTSTTFPVGESDRATIKYWINDFKGGMVENYVNTQLIMNGYNTYYWESERGAEIDFVIQRDGKLIPIEVKSADNTKAKSLKVYMETYKPDYAIKLSTKNFGFEDKKKTVPLYAAFCI